tara:strand:- start:8 stop:190 length:183 start_codon:yes stop_codon:yes gene_type:complete
MNKSKKTKEQIEIEMKEELRKQGVDIKLIDDFGDVYSSDDDLLSKFKDSKGEYGDDSYEY